MFSMNITNQLHHCYQVFTNTWGWWIALVVMILALNIVQTNFGYAPDDTITVSSSEWGLFTSGEITEREIVLRDNLPATSAHSEYVLVSGGGSFVFTALYYVLGALVGYATSALAIIALREQRLSRRLVARYVSVASVLSYTIALGILYVLVVLGGLFLIVPGVLLWLLFALAPLHALDNRSNVWDSFWWCIQNTTQHLRQNTLASLVSMGCIVGSVLGLGIALLFFVPFMQLFWARSYLQLQDTNTPLPA